MREMRDNDWYLGDDDDNFGEALHRRTEELYSVPDAILDEDGLIECPVYRCETWWCSPTWFHRFLSS